MLSGVLCTIVALLFWTASAGSTDTLPRVWLEGPHIGFGTRGYELWLSDFTDVLAVDVDVLLEGQAGMAQVLPRAEAAGFISAANAVDDTLKIVLARAVATAHAGPLVEIVLPVLQPEPDIGLLWVALNSGAIRVDYESVAPPPVSFTFSLDAGWSLISLPVVPQDPTLVSLFPDAISAFRFTPGSGYELADELATCAGYWLNLASGGDYVVPGSGDVSACQLSLGSGWSLIGVPRDGGAVPGIGQDPPDNLISIFGFESGYTVADQVAAGAGYWVNLASAGDLSLTGADGGPASRPAATARTAGALLWVEAGVGRQELHLGVESERRVELPPRPPAGVLDLRVTVDGTDTRAVPLSDEPSLYRVQVQGEVQRLGWRIGSEQRGRWQLLVDGQVWVLDGTGSLQLSSPDAEIRLRGGPRIPATIALHPAYPNPINPSTIIRYDLVEGGEVTLRVYDVAGRPVRTLVAARQSAGRYSVTWDGHDGHDKNVASGVYLYELRAGRCRDVGRMVLVR